jgi:hypothetical protein
MSASDNMEVRDAFRQWAEEMDCHQYQIFVETAKMVDLLKEKKVSAKTKNEMLIIIKGLQATVKSVNKVLSKYIK